jgi:hypothetical protein
VASLAVLIDKNYEPTQEINGKASAIGNCQWFRRIQRSSSQKN